MEVCRHDVIRGYILCPLLTYGYLLPKMGLYLAQSLFSSAFSGSAQEL